MSKNIFNQEFTVTQKDRIKKYGHKPSVIWLTGLSGSGKSTIANKLEEELFKNNFKVYHLDGDNIRFGLNSDLGFSEEDRTENIRRITEVANLFSDAGMIVVVSFISPFKADRDKARELIGDNFIEVFVDTPLEVCEQRDVKGLYAKARNGELKEFTGISSPYERPENPELRIDTTEKTILESVNKVFDLIVKNNIVKPN